MQADVAELTETEVGTDGKTYKVWWVVEPASPASSPGKYLVDETGPGPLPDRPGHRRPAQLLDLDGADDQEVQPAAAPRSSPRSSTGS